MRIKEINESTVAGSIASVAMPMGEVQKREQPENAPKVKKGRKFANTISEGAMKKLAYDLMNMDAGNFAKTYGKTKEYFSKLGNPPAQTPPAKIEKPLQKKPDAAIHEDELKEEDLIILPGMLRGRDTGFISKEHDRRDHEVEMARSDLYAAAKDAMRIFQLIADRTEDEGLMGWQQSYITLAADYLNSVADSLELHHATEGVIAGGMSNFEEDTVREISDFKKKELEFELRNEPKNNYAVAIDGRTWKVFADKQQAENIARSLIRKGKKAAVYTTGASVREEQAPMFTPEQEQLDEKKDACYSKVKSRYKVWPSAYASGALSKCRKVGASNWGNKSKK